MELHRTPSDMDLSYTAFREAWAAFQQRWGHKARTLVVGPPDELIAREILSDTLLVATAYGWHPTVRVNDHIPALVVNPELDEDWWVLTDGNHAIYSVGAYGGTGDGTQDEDRLRSLLERRQAPEQAVPDAGGG